MTAAEITQHQTDIPVESLRLIGFWAFGVANCVRQALPTVHYITANMRIARHPDAKGSALFTCGTLPVQEARRAESRQCSANGCVRNKSAPIHGIHGGLRVRTYL